MKNQNFEQHVVAARPENSSTIDWHSAFFGAIQLDLDEYQDVLEFHAEYQLTDQPLRIDCLVIKKAKDVEIKKNIAAIFREWNIVEYKSPGDYVSIGDFYKAHAYAYQLAWLKDVSITEMTISFVESHYPQKLLEYLQKELHFTVAKTASGIYTISGDILPIQVIDSRELPADESQWLKNLSNRLDPLEVVRMRRLAAQQGKDVRIDAYLNAIIEANLERIQEEIDMTAVEKFDAKMDQWFEELGGAARWEAKGQAEGKIIGFEEGKLAIARKLKARGQPLAEIAEITDLPIETIENL